MICAIDAIPSLDSSSSSHSAVQHELSRRRRNGVPWHRALSSRALAPAGSVLRTVDVRPLQDRLQVGFSMKPHLYCTWGIVQDTRAVQSYTWTVVVSLTLGIIRGLPPLTVPPCDLSRLLWTVKDASELVCLKIVVEFYVEKHGKHGKYPYDESMGFVPARALFVFDEEDRMPASRVVSRNATLYVHTEQETRVEVVSLGIVRSVAIVDER
ncbi:hypothetical protein F4818DRAFT_117549 [Hypoxylon cercidicola]|nr:hypothetical protein F4818DRAFT_117549 [Hypoxylon cercidicola]